MTNRMIQTCHRIQFFVLAYRSKIRLSSTSCNTRKNGLSGNWTHIRECSLFHLKHLRWLFLLSYESIPDVCLLAQTGEAKFIYTAFAVIYGALGGNCTLHGIISFWFQPRGSLHATALAKSFHHILLKPNISKPAIRLQCIVVNNLV